MMQGTQEEVSSCKKKKKSKRKNEPEVSRLVEPQKIRGTRLGHQTTCAPFRNNPLIYNKV